jgi:hypothetical protein
VCACRNPAGEERLDPGILKRDDVLRCAIGRVPSHLPWLQLPTEAHPPEQILERHVLHTPDQPSLPAKVHNLLEETLEDSNPKTLHDAGQAGVIEQLLIQGVAERVSDGPH